MVLILKGEIHVRRREGGPMALFIGRAGQITGRASLLAHEELRRAGIRHFASMGAARFPSSLFPEMLQAIPSMAQRVVSTLLDRVREVTRIEQQAEKLAALGKLAGNLAHELNNPASAAQRAAASLVAALRANRANRFKLVGLRLNEQQMQAIEAWEEKILCRQPQPLERQQDANAMAFIAREESLRAWLAPSAAATPGRLPRSWPSKRVTVADLDELREVLSDN